MRAVLGDHFIGFYLGGSLALGDFDPRQSDIDFVAVIVDELPPETIAALEEMHTRLWATGTKWAMKLDGSYVSQQVLRRWTSDHPPCPFIEADSFQITNQGSAVIQRHILRQYGIVVAGPSPHTLMDPVDDLRNPLWDMLEKWWRPLLDDPAWLNKREKQPFAILSMCRALYTLDHGELASKLVAARWAQQTTGELWRRLIDWALTQPHDFQSNHMASTLSLIRYTLDRYQQYYEGV